MDDGAVELERVLQGVAQIEPEHRGLRISTITADSREVVAGAVFVAIPGSQQDGDRFIADAIARGASAVVAGRVGSASGAAVVVPRNMPLSVPSNVSRTPIISVSDPRKALSHMAANFYGHAASKLVVTGVTGTNGKTTSCWLLHQTLSVLGRSTLRLGTAGNFLAGVLEEQSALTTLDPVRLHQLFAMALERGATHAALEASSHALHQSRLDRVPLAVAIFTNLTRDHLDYHGTFEAYELAKRGIFDLLKDDGSAVINYDDAAGRRYAGYCRTRNRRVVAFGRQPDLTAQLKDTAQPNLAVRIVSVTSSADIGTSIVVDITGRLPQNTPLRITSPLIGEFNAENIVAVFCALLELGFTPQAAASAFAQARGAPGRLERFAHNSRTVFVDYAHTPDALERALIALRPVTKGRLSVVFGCGGDRDRGKRPQMGAIAQRLADRVIVTSDNPRTEDPHRIIADIVAGAGSNFVQELDRARAISGAIAAMVAGDVLLVAGKGHENYQIFADKTVPFSDQDVVREALRAGVL